MFSWSLPCFFVRKIREFSHVHSNVHSNGAEVQVLIGHRRRIRSSVKVVDLATDAASLQKTSWRLLTAKYIEICSHLEGKSE